MNSIEKQNEQRERCRQANASVCLKAGYLHKTFITADELLDEVLAKAQRIKNEPSITNIAQKTVKIVR